jgi:hypothetical protein
MKTTNCSFQIFKLSVATTVATVIMCGLSVRSTQAGYVVTLQQVGSNVVATGSGAIDLTGLGPGSDNQGQSAIEPGSAFITTGPTGISNADTYSGFSGPTSFGLGIGMVTFANSGSGDLVGILGAGALQFLIVPRGYVSGNALSDGSTYNGATFTTLGITPGTYTWTWGTGANQNFTLDAIATGVPDSGSTFGLFFVSLIALFGVGRFRAQRLA